MKKILSNICTLAALAMMTAAAFTACSSDDGNDQIPPLDKTYTMSVEAAKGMDTRALLLDVSTLNATWAAGERVTVHNDTKNADLVGYLEAETDGTSTTLAGSLTGVIESGDVLTLKFNSDDYSGQDGTLDYIASHCDYATATTTATVAGSSITGTAATFTNQQAIVRFTLKDKASNGSISATTLVVNDGTTDYTVTPASATDVLYVAIPGFSGQTVSLTATVGDNTYTYEKSDVTFANGQYYEIGVKMKPSTPLTMQALSSGTIVVKSPKDGMQYSVNGGAKTPISSTENPKTINVEAGDKVEFYGNGTNISSYFPCIIGGTAEVKAYGNIMSLMDETGFASNTTLTANYALACLFAENTQLTDASGLILPATTLTTQCYENMFRGCTGLTTAPALPATTMVSRCYERMFYGCTSLTTAPALPAETLASRCYQEMFKDCSSLSAITCLATDKSATSCTKNWVSGVASSGTFTRANKNVSWSTGFSGRPSDWTLVDAE